MMSQTQPIYIHIYYLHFILKFWDDLNYYLPSTIKKTVTRFTMGPHLYTVVLPSMVSKCGISIWSHMMAHFMWVSSHSVSVSHWAHSPHRAVSHSMMHSSHSMARANIVSLKKNVYGPARGHIILKLSWPWRLAHIWTTPFLVAVVQQFLISLSSS